MEKSAVAVTFVHRNQYAFGFVTGLLACTLIIGIIQTQNSTNYTYINPDLSDGIQLTHYSEDDIPHDSEQMTADKAASNLQQGCDCEANADVNTPSAAQEANGTSNIWNSPQEATINSSLPVGSVDYPEVDTSVADLLKKKIRVLCWVMTSPDNLFTKAIHSYRTWAHRCNKAFFVSSKENSSFPAPIIKVDTEEGRDHLTAKTMQAFKYIYDHHFNDAEWFMKADDDTFVIVENLRYFLSDRNPLEPVYYGHHYAAFVEPQGYYGGGGGYVISKEALKRLGEKGFGNEKVCRKDGGAEDVEFGKCMQNLDVKTAESYDRRGGSRFHGLDPQYFFHGQFPYWFYNMDSHGAKHGVHTISDYPISFHYMPPETMYEFAFYVYHLNVYGIKTLSRPHIHSYYLAEI